MKRDIGIQQAVFPMPVLMIATYGEDGKVDMMNAAWGNICDPDKIALFLSAEHKTVKNMNAPVIEEFPVVMECELLEEVNTENLHCYVGKIVSVAAEEEYLDVNGKLDVGKCGIIAFDNFKNSYYAVGEKVGEAWSEGAKLM